MPRLTIQEGGEPVEYDILDDEVGIGRGAASEVQLVTTAASKHHAVLRRIRGRYKLIDLESLNGTRINGRCLNQRWLMDGDEIRIGDATLRYDAEGAEQGPPVAKVARPKVVAPATPAVAVRPVPAKPAAAKPVPAKPAAAKAASPAPAAPAPAVPKPAAPKPVASPPLAAPTPARPAAPVAARPAPAPSRAAAPAPSRRRARDDDRYDDEDGYDDERGGRRVPRKNNGPWIALGVIGGALVFAFLVFALFGGGSSENRDLLHQGIELARKQKYADALRLAEQHGDPAGAHYDLLRDEMDNWRMMLRGAQVKAMEDESREFWDKQILRKSWSPTLNPVDRMDDVQTVQRIREWLARYPDTLAVRHLVAGEDETMQHYRQLLREHPDPTFTPHVAVESVREEVQALRDGRLYGLAIDRLERLEGTARLQMTREAWTELEARLRTWKQELRGLAATEVEADMARARELINGGQRVEAIRKLKTILRRYPRDLVPDAMSMLEKLG